MFGFMVVLAVGAMHALCKQKPDRRKLQKAQRRAQRPACGKILHGRVKKPQRDCRQAVMNNSSRDTVGNPNTEVERSSHQNVQAVSKEQSHHARAGEEFLSFDQQFPDVSTVRKDFVTPFGPRFPVASVVWSGPNQPKERAKSGPYNVLQRRHIADPLALTNVNAWMSDYHSIRHLTTSTDGPVDLVQNIRSGELCIVKHVTCNGKDREGRWILPQEPIVLMDHLAPHTNVVRLRERHLDTTVTPPECYMVLEYCNAGDLENLVESVLLRSRQDNEPVLMPEPIILHVLSSLIDALAFLHEGVIEFDARTGDALGIWERQEAVLHRDIKTDNVFLRWTQDARYGLPEVVLGDFGFAAPLPDSKGFGGTEGFMAPEVTDARVRVQRSARDRQHVENSPICSKASDVFSLGATLYRLLSLEYYTPDSDLATVFRTSEVAHRQEILEILRACMSEDPADRPSVALLLPYAAHYKRELDLWNRNGGRIAASFWADPFMLHNQESALVGLQTSRRDSNSHASSRHNLPTLDRKAAEIQDRSQSKLSHGKDRSSAEKHRAKDLNAEDSISDKELCNWVEHKELAPHHPGSECLPYHADSSMRNVGEHEFARTPGRRYFTTCGSAGVGAASDLHSEEEQLYREARNMREKT